MVVGDSFPTESEDRTADVKTIVIRYTSPLQRVQYQVVGTKTNCYVFPSLPVWTDSQVNKYFCDCPAFTLSVLSAESNFMASAFSRHFGRVNKADWVWRQCKHLLATYLAERLGRVAERKLGFEEWAILMLRMSNKENR